MARSAREQLSQIMASYSIAEPKHWSKMSKISQIDFVATRILADNRTTTSHNAMREEGILSVSQYDRRLAKEVYSTHGSLDELPPERGVFGRRHVKRQSPKSQRLD